MTTRRTITYATPAAVSRHLADVARAAGYSTSTTSVDAGVRVEATSTDPNDGRPHFVTVLGEVECGDEVETRRRAELEVAFALEPWAVVANALRLARGEV